MHVAFRHSSIGFVMATIFSLSVLTQAAQAQTQIGMLWQVPIDEAWDYGIKWRENQDAGGIEGYLRPQILVENEDGMITGSIVAPSGDTLRMYGEESRLVVTYGYDSGKTSRMFLVTPENGEFSFEVPEEYSDAGYVKIWSNGHAFSVKPSGTYPASGNSTTIVGPTNQTSSSTFTTDDGLEGTTETVVVEEATTTVEVDADEELVVTVTTVESLVTETTTVTTPKSDNEIELAEVEMTDQSGVTSNSTSTISTSEDGRITTEKDITTNITSQTEVTSDEEQTVKVTTITTNNTSITTETVSLAFETDLVTIWDNHEYLKIDGYSIFEGEYVEHTFCQGTIKVIINAASTEYRLEQ